MAPGETLVRSIFLHFGQLRSPFLPRWIVNRGLSPVRFRPFLCLLRSFRRFRRCRCFHAFLRRFRCFHTFLRVCRSFPGSFPNGDQNSAVFRCFGMFRRLFRRSGTNRFLLFRTSYFRLRPAARPQ